MRPKSSSLTLIWRKSIALTVPSVISSSYFSPVRLSVTDSVSCAVATPPPFSLCVCSSAIALSPRLLPVLGKGYGSAAPAAEEPRELGRSELRRLERQLRHLGRGDRERHRPFGGARHLGSVDETALAGGGPDHDPVEDALPVEVADLVDRAPLHLVRREDRRALGQLAVVDGDAVVDHVRWAALRLSVRPRSSLTRAGGRGSGSPCGPRRGGPGLRGRGWSGPTRGFFQSSAPVSAGSGGRVAHQTR